MRNEYDCAEMITINFNVYPFIINLCLEIRQPEVPDVFHFTVLLQVTSPMSVLSVYPSSNILVCEVSS